MSTYDTDFYTWTRAQAEALRHKDWAALDVDHLAEEIADLGQSIENAIESQLERILLHLLKYRYDPAQPAAARLAPDHPAREARDRQAAAQKSRPAAPPRTLPGRGLSACPRRRA